MNSPQIESGFIQIATGDGDNDLLSALIRAGLTGVEYQVVLFILRKTYGYKKKEDWISVDQFVEVTGRTHRGVLNAVFALEERKIIVRRKEWRKVFYAINKTFHTWSVVNSGSVNKSSVDSTDGLNSRSESTELPCKNGLNSSSDTKEKIQKKSYKRKPPLGVSAAPAVVTPGFFPHPPMDTGFVVEPDGSVDHRAEPKKRKNPRGAFTWQDDTELVRIMKQTCGFTTLENGKKPADNWARHILVKVYKILVEDYKRDDQDAIDHIRANMEELCMLIQRARDGDKFMWRKLTTLKSIYYDLPTVFEMAKARPAKSSSHLSL